MKRLTLILSLALTVLSGCHAAAPAVPADAGATGPDACAVDASVAGLTALNPAAPIRPSDAGSHRLGSFTPFGDGGGGGGGGGGGSGFAPDAGDVVCDGGYCAVQSVSGTSATAGTIPFRQGVLQFQVDASSPLGGIPQVSLVSESPVNYDGGTSPPWLFVNGSTNIGTGPGGNIGLLGGFAVADAGAMSGSSSLCTWNVGNQIVCPFTATPSGTGGQVSFNTLTGSGNACQELDSNGVPHRASGPCLTGATYPFTQPLTPPPLVSSLTWVNQDLTTATDRASALEFTSVTNTANQPVDHSLLVTSEGSCSGGSPCSFTVGFVPALANCNGAGGGPITGIAFRESSTGKLIEFYFYLDASPQQHISVQQLTDPRTAALNYKDVVLGQFIIYTDFGFFRETDDGTNLDWYASKDGDTYFHFFGPRSRTEFMDAGGGPDQVGVVTAPCAASGSTGVAASSMRVISWRKVP